MMNLRILVRYEDTSGNIKGLIDSNESVDVQGNEMLSYSPGTYISTIPESFQMI